ncbi:MAG: uroporphyrinogen decarboxylase family protein [Opitutaceae bacterium]|jgi:hypothetical protein|nr:uroporphyrinogen decarboxylase family protein [Opitutaceae bacterium]
MPSFFFLSRAAPLGEKDNDKEERRKSLDARPHFESHPSVVSKWSRLLEFGNSNQSHPGQHRVASAGTPEDVRGEVFSRLELFRGEGGFILAPAHSVQPDVPVENIIALYDAARKSNTRRAAQS